MDEQGWPGGMEGQRTFYPQEEALKRVCSLAQAEGRPKFRGVGKEEKLDCVGL